MLTALYVVQYIYIEVMLWNRHFQNCPYMKILKLGMKTCKLYSEQM